MHSNEKDRRQKEKLLKKKIQYFSMHRIDGIHSYHTDDDETAATRGLKWQKTSWVWVSNIHMEVLAVGRAKRWCNANGFFIYLYLYIIQKLHSMGCIMSQCVSGMYSCECICQPNIHTLLLLLLQLHTKLLWKGVITLGRIIWINYFEKHRFSCSGNMYFEISLLLDFHGRQRRLNAQHNP